MQELYSYLSRHMRIPPNENSGMFHKNRLSTNNESFGKHSLAECSKTIGRKSIIQLCEIV